MWPQCLGHEMQKWLVQDTWIKRWRCFFINWIRMSIPVYHKIVPLILGYMPTALFYTCHFPPKVLWCPAWLGRISQKTKPLVPWYCIAQDPRFFCGLLSLSPKLISGTRLILQTLHQCSIEMIIITTCRIAYAAAELRSWNFLLSSSPPGIVAKSIP